MDDDDEMTACVAAYYVLLCGEFLRSKAAFISKNGLRGQTQSFVSAPVANVQEKINPAPRPHDVEARQTIVDGVSNSAPHVRPGGDQTVNSAPQTHKRSSDIPAAPAVAKKTKKKLTPRTLWMRPLYKSRFGNGARDLLSDLKEPSGGKLENFCHMCASDFEMILSKIAPSITKQTTNMRESVPPHERLAVALRFLATGESFKSLSLFCKFSLATVSLCVTEVCEALIKAFQDEIKLPTSKDHWLSIAEQYKRQWNFPNCLGAIGGKHIIGRRSLRPQANDVEVIDTSVLILLALVDANYCFTFVDIGFQGLLADGSSRKNSSLITKFQVGQVDLPPDSPLPSSSIPMPYVFLGDTTFTLSQRTMTPYAGFFEKKSAQRIFNYRLSRARQVIRNVFGTMVSVFGVLRKQIMLEPEKVTNIIKACVLLHNILRKSPSSPYPPPGTFDTEDNGTIHPGSWRSIDKEIKSFLDVKKETMGNPEEIAKEIRNSFAEYFTTYDKLPWQDDCC